MYVIQVSYFVGCRLVSFIFFYKNFDLAFKMTSGRKINLKFLYDLGNNGKKAVIDWCMHEGLISNMYKCPVCAKGMSLVERNDRSDGFEWVCRVKGANAHHIKRSIRKGSWFEESHLSMMEILIFTWMWVYGANSEMIKTELNINNDKTITDWKNFCRDVCVDICARKCEMIGGPGVIVEIDESKFGKRKYNRGKRVDGNWVFGGVERGSKRCFFEVVPDRTKETLLNLIKQNILPGTTIISDCWKSYECLSENDFKHLQVNHTKTFKDPATGAHTNKIEGMWSVIKREFRKKSHRQSATTEAIFNSYFAEFMWRWRYTDSTQDKYLQYLVAIREFFVPQSEDIPAK